MPHARPPDSPLAARFLASPNRGERRGHGRPNCLILHYTGMPTGEAALRRLLDPASEVSAHYFVWEDGAIDQLVPRATGPGTRARAFWKGETDLNSASIGVEIVNPGHDGGSPPFPDRQIAATIALGRDICARWTIPPERVLAHSDIAPARKRDPGEAFPWETLWRGGVGSWTEPAPVSGGLMFSHEEEGPPVARCKRCSRSTAMAWRSRACTTAKPDRSSPRSSATSGPKRSTARPMLRRSRR